MVVRSLAFFIVTMAALAYVWRPWHVLALRALLGFFAGYGPLAMTMAAESAPAEQMATALGWVQTAQRLGPAVGPVIGGVLAQSVGLRRSFLVASVFYVCALLLVAIGYRDVAARTAAAREPHEALSFRRLTLIPHFLLFMGTIFGLQLVDRSFGPVLPLLRDDWHGRGTSAVHERRGIHNGRGIRRHRQPVERLAAAARQRRAAGAANGAAGGDRGRRCLARDRTQRAARQLGGLWVRHRRRDHVALHHGEPVCPAGSRGVAFGYLSTVFVGARGQSGRRRLYRIAKHARRILR